ncbi:PREDICTED: zygote arrest protein 1 [Elephantulus edwardii]|uniref:zygote arrest protein 1 n=1 Tax=Elephantulus edwardii TaxID=28737 RepID=UPI0003F0A51C|nr:PREDICTED: zygote arrest protein 1 [Elephantulus edwardii]
MAAQGKGGLDGYMYPACTPYSYSYPFPPAAKGKVTAGGGAWRHRGRGYFPAPSSAAAAVAAASSSFPGYGQLMAAEYFENYQRAQLMALLSQVSPGLAPRPRRASSRDVGVQVNPRRDASVQCSLGRRTLLRRAREAGSEAEGAREAGSEGAASPQPGRRGPELGSPPGGAPRGVRFPRTIAVYSPVVSRRLTTFLEGPEAGEGEHGPPPRESSRAAAKKTSQWPQSEEEEADEAQVAVRKSWEDPEPTDRAKNEEDAAGSGERLSSQSPEPPKERLRFQFLEQKYGYYHCKDCNIRWESAYVWCVQGTNKVYFKQFCRSCQKSYNPYRVEDITCQNCNQTRCSCPVKLRHVDPKRPHRQDLCGRCKGKRLSCDSTFSFKYII